MTIPIIAKINGDWKLHKSEIVNCCPSVVQTSVEPTSYEFPVPKYMGINASHIIHVVYIVKPMNFDSLKFSGILRVLTAYTVQIVISSIL